MAQDFAKGFYVSEAWQACRANVMRKYKWLCQGCLSKGLYVPATVVHHKKKITAENVNDPRITLNENNLIPLCVDCHAKAHTEKKNRFEFDEDGNIAPPIDE